MADSKSTIAAHQSRMDTNMIQIGIVKDNRDPKKMGRLKVWIQGSSSVENSKTGWITCSYASPFAGNTKGVPNAKGFADHPKSYGFWAVPPDVGTRVFVFFVNGRQEHAYWFGCGYDTGMNGMVPAPSAEEIPGSGHNGPIPVVEYDRNTPNKDINSHYINSPLLDGLIKQNLLHEYSVGSVNRSSRRQAPSQVYGMSTPRGNHIVLDDGYLDSELKPKYWDDDADDYQNTEVGNPANDTVVGARKCEGILLRTRSGAQLFISESDGFVFLINRDGTARMTMTPDGDIEFNGRDIKLRAKRNLEFRCEKNMKTEVFGNSDTYVEGTTSNEHLGRFEYICKSDTVSHVDGNYNFYAKKGLALQGDAGASFVSPAAVNIDSGSTLNLKGASNVAMSGGGGNANLSGNFNVSLSVSAGGDVSSSASSLNKHTHANVQNGEGVTPPPSGGTGQTPNAPAAADGFKASQSVTTRHELKEAQDVAAVKAGGTVDKQVQKDIDLTQTKSLSSLSAVMPASGTIDSTGYWGKDVVQSSGKTADNPGWLVMGSGPVSAMYGGYVVNRTTNTVQIDHGNGFQSMYKGIKVSDAIQDGTDVTVGQTIGSYKDMFLFEVRIMGAPLYGFTGTVDPGRFYVEETGIGKDAANKTLTVNKKTNTTVEVVATQSGESALVSKYSGKTICDTIVSSGSTHIPGNRDVSAKQYDEARDKEMYSVLDNGKRYQSPEGWVVESTNKQLLDSIVVHEGDIAYQSNKNYVKNGKFYPYRDRTMWAIGYGHNFREFATYADGITEAVARNMLANDTENSVYYAKKIYADKKMRIPEPAQRVLVEMVYQMGYGKVTTFKKFLNALTQGSYSAAIFELRDSLLYEQTPNRVEDYIKLLKPFA